MCVDYAIGHREKERRAGVTTFATALAGYRLPERDGPARGSQSELGWNVNRQGCSARHNRSSGIANCYPIDAPIGALAAPQG